MKTKLRKYQKRGVRRLHAFKGRALLADEMGLGKTVQALFYSKEVPKARPIVVVCPASVKYNWETEAKRHIRMRADVLEGRKSRTLRFHSPLLIINYDILGAWLKKLKRLNPQIVILDEVQKIKNRYAKRTKWVKKLCRGVKKVIALSGTPLTNKPDELYSILSILCPYLFDNHWDFAHRYCKPRRTPWGWKYDGAENLPQLHKLLKAVCMIRRRKKDVLKELPVLSRVVVPLKIKNEREYRAANNDFKQWLTKYYSSSKARRQANAERLVKGGYLLRLTAELKLEAVCEWLKNYEESTDSKLIVFGIHKAIVKELHQRFPNSVMVTGAIRGRKRQAAFDIFSNNHKIRFLFGNLVAAGLGWNGQAATATAHIEFSYVPADHSQAEKRVDRIGQTKPTTAYYLVARDTVEENLLKIIQSKQKILDATLDGEEESSDLNVFDEFMKTIHRFK